MQRTAVAILAAAAQAAATTTQYGQAYLDGDAVKARISDSPLPASNTSLAWGSFNDTLLSTGWSRLTLSTVSGAADESQVAYAAGFLEAALTWQRMYEFNTNNFGDFVVTPAFEKFLQTNLAYTRAQAAANAADPFWYHVALTNAQLQGLYDGYSQYASADKALPFLRLYLSTLVGDLDDLRHIFYGAQPAPPSDGHCSVLIKVLGDPAAPQELLAGHTTWSSFESMTRVFKTYDFPWRWSSGSAAAPGGDHAASAPLPGRVLSFSSYPGVLFSDDDYYVAHPSQLMITETTIDNRNSSLWQYVVPDAIVFEWQRNMVANRLANSGTEWVAFFSQQNSGTYNNAWHIVDYKLFTPGQPLRDFTLTMLEQMPGPNIRWHDMTDALRSTTHWDSYNRIYDPYLWSVTNQSVYVALYGDHYSYNLTARAQIFAREQAGVVDMPSFQALLRYNKFQTDPMGTQGCTDGVRSASNAIAERGDLTPAAAAASCVSDIVQQDEAATDCKVTSSALMASGKLSTLAISSPTYDDQPPFRWSTSPFANTPHVGQPDLWAFPWVQMDVELPATA